MEEAELNSESQEVATQEAEVQETPQEQKQPVDDHQERNWKAIRQTVEDLKRQNQEKDELLKKAFDFHQSNQKPATVNDEPEEPDDEYIPKGRVKKLAKKEIEPLQKEVEELKAQLSAQRQKDMIQGLRTKYSDFDDIVNQESLALFEEKEPELAATIAEIKDPYKLAIQSYKYIKASGLADEVPNRRHAKEAEKKLEKNSKTVQSPLAYEKRPMAQAFKLTESEKSKLWEEMNHYGAMASAVPYLS